MVSFTYLREILLVLFISLCVDIPEVIRKQMRKHNAYSSISHFFILRPRGERGEGSTADAELRPGAYSTLFLPQTGRVRVQVAVRIRIAPGAAHDIVRSINQLPVITGPKGPGRLLSVLERGSLCVLSCTLVNTRGKKHACVGWQCVVSGAS